MRVLLSLSPPDGTTKYVVQLTQGMPQEVTIEYFSWVRAILGKYDVFHVHWPEFLVRSNRPSRHAVKIILCAFFVVSLAVRRKPVVRTVHNIAPHEGGGRIEKMLLRAIDRLTVVSIRLNPHTQLPSNVTPFTILHGHYVDWFSSREIQERERGRLLNFGLIRPYKGVESLIDVVAGHNDSNLILRVVGKPIGREIRDKIIEKASISDRISLRLAFVQDDELISEIGRSELVILPYKEMHNSGAALLSLSLETPILVPSNPVTESLRAEVGPQWVHTFNKEVTAQDIDAALERTRSADSQCRPNLDGRDWEHLGRQHQEAYGVAVQTKRRLQ
ncbi:hypothetical protein FFI94_024155 [Rhodococcus sp. KBS0724]|uniref:hypothetical protein n=1 Tax=Rhodococcus sp. KBS0724 TaxID=1179674 RepID=UPI00110F5901|nr:hypothetical protein [Rhodococcus sp. KBS0724]TSD48929.1 hypothetical protein FFI94_024155 [Rhodococcus sp. KBS0724]